MTAASILIPRREGCRNFAAKERGMAVIKRGFVRGSFVFEIRRNSGGNLSCGDSPEHYTRLGGIGNVVDRSF